MINMNLETAIEICERHNDWITAGKVFTYQELNTTMLKEAIQVLVNNAKQDLEEDGWQSK